MSQCVVEPLEPPEAAGRDAFVGESECLTIGTRQVDDLLEELPRLVGRLVEADACEDDERPRQFRAGLERCDHLAKLGLGSARVTGLEVEERRLDRPPNLLGSSIGRGQLPGAVEEEGRRSQGSTCARVAGRILERGGHRLVRLVDGGGELPRAGLRIIEQLRQPGVDLLATHEVGGVVRTRGQQAGE